MAPILLVILAVEVTVAIVNAVGAQAINNVLWAIISLLPLHTSRLVAAQKKKQVEYINIRAELKATSSQDEFAKWAKLRRKHDKALEELENMKKGLEASRASFDRYVSTIRLLATRAPQWIVPMWYAGKPVFWLPHGLFPHSIEWLVALPKAPTGSVSPATWQVACSITLGLLVEIVKSLAPESQKPGGRMRPARQTTTPPATEKTETTANGGKATVEDEKAEL